MSEEIDIVAASKKLRWQLNRRLVRVLKPQPVDKAVGIITSRYSLKELKEVVQDVEKNYL